MTNFFSTEISKILAYSKEEAIRSASARITPEHLLMGILRSQNEPIIEMMNQMNINPQQIQQALEDKLTHDQEHLPFNQTPLELNEPVNNIMKLAVMEARFQQNKTVDVPHLFLAILKDETNNGAKEILESYQMNYENSKNYLRMQAEQTQNGIGLPEDDEDESEDLNGFDGDNHSSNRSNRSQTTAQTRTNGGETKIIDSFSVDLTRAAMEGKLDPVVGREHEMQRVMEILCRRKKNNPILIGEPGVGKSAIVEGLAQMIAKHKTSPILFNKRLVSLDMTSVVAGTKYRGQFEERIKALIKELEDNPNIIVFIDEIHTIIGAGSTPGSMDAANILKPALARGTIQCIGATTLDEYRTSIEKDGALERRFQKVQVEPTSAVETIQILENIKERYEQHHHVTYTDEAVKACVTLTERYVSDRAFPDKAIDALDEVGSRVHLQHARIPPEIGEKEKELEEVKLKKQTAVQKQNFELAAGYRDKQTQLEAQLEDLKDAWINGDSGSREEVGEKEVADVVATMTGIPVQRIAEAEGTRLKNMADRLKSEVIAQDNAIEKMVKAIQRNRVGLKEPNHPIGVFMFLGPTGVGKTYLAKKLAEEMFGSQDNLIRIDMSEFTESFNVSRLVGAPPGYVGYDEGGQLTEKVRRHPYSIVLLDEIEKAHGNVFNLLLQVLDEGRLTDGNGRLIDFRNTIIIMTSNAGTKQLKEFGRGVGFNAGGTLGLSLDEKDKEHARSIIQKSLAKQFSPEFLNRLDEIITFDQLDLNAIKQIINIELKGLYKRLDLLGYQMELSEKAKEFVATKGYDVQFGARPLKRAIQNYIEDGVCERILSGELKQGDTISIDKKDDEEKLFFVS